MGYKVTITYEIETSTFAKELPLEEVRKDLQRRAETSVGHGLPHFWTVKPESVRVKVKKK